MTDPLNITFDDFSIWLPGYRIDISCLCTLYSTRSLFHFFYFDQKSPFNINFSETTEGNVIKLAFGLSIVVLNQHVYCAALKVEILTPSSMGSICISLTLFLPKYKHIVKMFTENWSYATLFINRNKYFLSWPMHPALAYL